VEGIPLAVHPAAHLEIIVPQNSLAIRARKALRVELLSPLRLEILPLDSSVAANADAPIQLVVVALTVWRIVDHVEGRSLEWFHAGRTHEAFLVIPTRQPAISGRDGLARDALTTSFAVALRLSRLSAESQVS
jgi:hypothetical protein